MRWCMLFYFYSVSSAIQNTYNDSFMAQWILRHSIFFEISLVDIFIIAINKWFFFNASFIWTPQNILSNHYMVQLCIIYPAQKFWENRELQYWTFWRENSLVNWKLWRKSCEQTAESNLRMPRERCCKPKPIVYQYRQGQRTISY